MDYSEIVEYSLQLANVGIALISCSIGVKLSSDFWHWFK